MEGHSRTLFPDSKGSVMVGPVDEDSGLFLGCNVNGGKHFFHLYKC